MRTQTSSHNPPIAEKLTLPEQEEKILEFWEQHKIFEQSIKQRSKAPRFVFYDGPPFATGLPHYGHILASTVKDAVPRYWTMRGFRVDRRWGWDCHGLPIENIVEQELNISGRKAIEKFGIKNFNEHARSKVLTYASEWFKMIRRIGRFVDFENYYATMHPTYMESVLWAFATLFKKGLIYKDSRTSLFCPRCETPLSNFEIAMDNSYRDQDDDSVFVKLALEDSPNEYLLIWTTTPWTLPGNAAVAVSPKIEYTKFKINNEFIWSATPPPHEKGELVGVIEKRSGKSLIGKKYRPLFSLSSDKNAYRIVGADFVDIQEGTGLVHIAPAFGEEDFLLGKQEKLPMLATLDDTGRFSDEYSEIAFLKSKKTDEANKVLIEWLKTQHVLWKVLRIRHRYPICWRCQTPLIYKVQPAWFVKISALKKKMLALNKKIDWHPEHLKNGRFGKGLEAAPDWNISRSRFWGTPIPIWECSGCKKIHVIGSREEFDKKSKGAQNSYFIMRHGEAENNIRNIISSQWPEKEKFHLTLKGKVAVQETAQQLKKKKIDFIIASDFTRTRETAELVASVLGVKVHFDPRLREIKGLDGENNQEVEKYISTDNDRLTCRVPGGETLPELRGRIYRVVVDLEKEYHGKNILIVSHEHPLWALYAASVGLSDQEMLKMKLDAKSGFIKYAEVKKMSHRNVPRNSTGELDFHRPYVDEVKIFCDHCGAETKRVSDVLDCWFESGSMPYAEKHYPFENEELFEKNFPADFIAEYIAQTRGWFYTLHVLATALFGKPAFKHSVTTGNILSEKGDKLSKSKKNFPDPWLLINRYGVDAMRYYLMSSPVMLADNINFSEKDVDEVYKKYSLITLNVLNLYKMYRHNWKGNVKAATPSILDQWILSRLSSTTKEVTENFEAYEIAKAVRPLLDFVQDLSLWYVRRSRERIRTATPDAVRTLETLHDVLHDLARLMAPVTPFLAEIIYQELGNGKKKSVHLEDWPKANKKGLNKKLEEAMLQVRDLVSQALRARADAKIKVRQPLQKLQIATSSKIKNTELLDLIKNEVNVKEVIFGDSLELDTNITPELREEGLMRELIRNIQEMRRDAGLKPQNQIQIEIHAEERIQNIIVRWQKVIQQDLGARNLMLGGKKTVLVGKDLTLDGSSIWVGIRK